MKLILENWKKFLEQNYRGKSKFKYYWQTRGLWKGDAAIKFGTTHVPKAIPRDLEVEKIFEEVRKEKFPDRPSRLDCVYLCDSLKGFSGGSFCKFPAPEGGETYGVELRGNPKILKTNSEYWTEALDRWHRRKDEEEVRRWAKQYWEGDNRPTFGEILINPPESAIIMIRFEE